MMASPGRQALGGRTGLATTAAATERGAHAAPAPSGPAAGRWVTTARLRGVSGLVVVAIAATAAGCWVVASEGSALLALVPVGTVLGAIVLATHRQAAGYVMLASLPFAEISVGHGASLVRYVLLGALVAWALTESVFGSFAWLRPGRTDLKVLAWILASIASAAFLNTSAAPGLALTYLNLALVYYVCSRMIRDARQVRGAVLALSIGVGAVAVLTLADPALAGSFDLSGSVARIGPLGATGAAGINRFAGWLVVGTLLPWMALGRSRQPVTLLARALSVVSLVALVETVSKAGMIALGAGLLLWAVLFPGTGRGRRLIGLMALLPLAWLALPVSVHERFGQFLQPDSVAYSRFAIWDGGLRMFMAHPLNGVGVGNFARLVPAYFPQGTTYIQAQAPHNVVVGALAETGIMGTLLMAMMIGTILAEGFRLIRGDRRGYRVVARNTDQAASRQYYARLTAGLVVAYLVFLIVALSVDLERDRFFVALAGLVHGIYRVRAHDQN